MIVQAGGRPIRARILEGRFLLGKLKELCAGSVSKGTERTYWCGPPTFCLIGSPVALNLMVRFADF
jgi:hypothetical protein